MRIPSSIAMAHNASIDTFCEECLWKRWDDKAQHMSCIGRVKEMVAEAMQKQPEKDFRVVEEEAKLSILNDFDCIDPNFDVDDDQQPSSNERLQLQSFCADCLWKGTNYKCGTKINNMVEVYTIPRERAIATAVLMNCTDDGNSSIGSLQILSMPSFESGIVQIIAIVAVFLITRRYFKQYCSIVAKLVFGIFGVVTATSLFQIQMKGTTTTTSTEKLGDEVHFSLCNCNVYVKDMAPLPPQLEFGFSEWKRNYTFGILMDSTFLYGRTGNHIRSVFHAMDMARDGSRSLIIQERGFPIDTPLNELFMGLQRSNLERVLGITFYDNVPDVYKSMLPSVRGGQFMRYQSSSSLQERINHRNYVLQELYRLTAKEMELNPESPVTRGMWQSLNAIFGNDRRGVTGEQLETPGLKYGVTEKYTVIHSRSFEGVAYKLLEGDSKAHGDDPRAMIEFPSDLLLEILSPLAMSNNSILMISDGQNTSVSERLSSDPTIGPYFQEIAPNISNKVSDIMLAILSTVFIGNPSSTYSQYIAQVRYALGLGPSYLHAKRKDGRWQTFCEDVKCFYEFHNP